MWWFGYERMYADYSIFYPTEYRDYDHDIPVNAFLKTWKCFSAKGYIEQDQSANKKPQYPFTDIGAFMSQL